MSNSLSEREQIVRDAVADGINEFLAQVAFGYTREVAFERAVDGDTDTRLTMPSNLRIEVLP